MSLYIYAGKLEIEVETKGGSMKLFSLVLMIILLIPANSTIGLSSADLNHRKIKLDMSEVLMHHQLRSMTSANRHQLVENQNGVRPTSFSESANVKEEGASKAVDQLGNSIGESKDDSGSEYHGNGINYHHSIDLESWNRLHTPPPDH